MASASCLSISAWCMASMLLNCSSVSKAESKLIRDRAMSMRRRIRLIAALCGSQLLVVVVTQKGVDGDAGSPASEGVAPASALSAVFVAGR